MPTRLKVIAPSGDRALSNASRFLYVGTVLVLGLGSAVAWSVAAGNDADTDGFRWTLYMGASALICSVLGLIFGVPRARAEFAAEASERYSSNSNLEQISDWLTKLLVGAGLTQLVNIPPALRKAGDYLGSGMALPNPSAFVVSALLYGGGVGFCSAYLWTRLRLRILLEISDRRAADSSKADDLTRLLLEQPDGESGDSVGTLRRVAEYAVGATGALTSGALGSILWVDDYPTNNVSLVAAFNRLGIDVMQVRTTEEALAVLQGPNSIRLVISDLGRRENDIEERNAGQTLLVELRERFPSLPVIIFASARAVRLRDELMQAGAIEVTNRKSLLMERAIQVLTRRS